MNKYELMYIIDASLEDEPRKELIERVSTLITGNAGEVEKVDEWGKRRLAYPINYKNEGYYVLVNFTASPELPREIERVLQINEKVLRYLIIRIEEKHTSVKPRQNAARPQYGRPFDFAAQDAAIAAQEAAAPIAPVAQEAAPVAQEAAPAAPAQSEAPEGIAQPVPAEEAPKAPDTAEVVESPETVAEAQAEA